ncbi:hypothetical protein HIM_02050 [Hirsutella minnesotensis 3608]|nr:hypothetical protein HIM_02050 [Hirsutella minnesotensis 3608]
MARVNKTSALIYQSFDKKLAFAKSIPSESPLYSQLPDLAVGSPMSNASSNSFSEPGTDSGNKGKSLYQRYQEKKRGPGVSDQDIMKYTGKTREELQDWAGSQPGVGKNQLAGTLAMGRASGFGGLAASAGFGGWGPSAHPTGSDRGMKFPPEPGVKNDADSG